jgi:glycosyltransferase involved in cell wall biosynthesis
MSKISKIAIVWESETGGGVNSYLRYLLQSHSFLDKQITIFTNSENKGAKLLINDLKEQKNIKFIFFNSFFVFERKRSVLEKFIYYFLKPVLLIFAIFKFKRIFSNLKFDVLLCTCGNYGNFRSEQAAIFASKNLNIPVKSIVVHHACVKPPLFMGNIFKIIDYFLSKTLTCLIAVSSATKDTVLKNSNLLSSGKLKNYVIHNGVPKNKYLRKNYLDIKFIKNFDSKLKIGMVSRLSPDKGHEDLIKAFSRLPLEYQKKMTIIIIGEDEAKQKERLENLSENLNIKNNINFLNYVNLDSKKIILSLDLFVSLTRSYEGFGLSIAEAMSVGTPILATDVGAVKEFFNDDCGQLIKPNQIDQIKNSLINFCDQRKDWEKKAQIAKNRIEKYFNSEIMGDNYMSHLLLEFDQNK